MKPDTVNALTAAFPKSAVKKNPQKMDYVPVAEVVARMNESVGVGRWRVEILNSFGWGNVETGLGGCAAHIVAHVRVHVFDDETGEWTWTEGMGGQDVGFYKDRSKGPLNLGDAYKGAVSDATKKALQGMGVALELARGEENQQVQEPTVDLWDYIKATDPDGSPKLTEAERAALTEAWKADGYPFGPGAVPQSREAELKTLIDSYAGTAPDVDSDARESLPEEEPF